MSDSSPEARYRLVSQHFRGRENVTQEGKGFGSSALKVNGRIFAMLTSHSEFVVKLPRARVEALIRSGDGLAYDAGKGRPMKEWLVIRADSVIEWASIGEEALAFVAGQARR
jgi:hypothetical protein